MKIRRILAFAATGLLLTQTNMAGVVQAIQKDGTVIDPGNDLCTGFQIPEFVSLIVLDKIFFEGEISNSRLKIETLSEQDNDYKGEYAALQGMSLKLEYDSNVIAIMTGHAENYVTPSKLTHSIGDKILARDICYLSYLHGLPVPCADNVLRNTQEYLQKHPDDFKAKAVARLLRLEYSNLRQPDNHSTQKIHPKEPVADRWLDLLVLLYSTTDLMDQRFYGDAANDLTEALSQFSALTRGNAHCTNGRSVLSGQIASMLATRYLDILDAQSKVSETYVDPSNSSGQLGPLISITLRSANLIGYPSMAAQAYRAAARYYLLMADQERPKVASIPDYYTTTPRYEDLAERASHIAESLTE